MAELSLLVSSKYPWRVDKGGRLPAVHQQRENIARFFQDRKILADGKEFASAVATALVRKAKDFPLKWRINITPKTPEFAQRLKDEKSLWTCEPAKPKVKRGTLGPLPGSMDQRQLDTVISS